MMQTIQFVQQTEIGFMGQTVDEAGIKREHHASKLEDLQTMLLRTLEDEPQKERAASLCQRLATRLKPR